MKEFRAQPGQHIQEACEQLAANAPAFMSFNGVRVEAQVGDLPSDLHGRWQADMDRQRREYEASDEFKESEARRKAADAENDRLRKETRTTVSAAGIREKYPWSPGMGEISGFGGDYEAACRDMLYAGLMWLDTRPGADLQAKTLSGVFGLLMAESEDAKALEKAVLSGCPDCSGAMHHAVMSACLYIAKNGWPAYVEAMSKPRGL